MLKKYQKNLTEIICRRLVSYLLHDSKFEMQYNKIYQNENNNVKIIMFSQKDPNLENDYGSVLSS